MSTEKLTIGDTVYTPSGSEVVLVSVEHDGYVVRPFLGTGNAEMGEDDLGDPELVRKVYARPPAERLAESAAQAQAAAEEARAAVNAARNELREVASMLAAHRKMLTAHPDLQPLVEYMEGRITHVATINYTTIKIQSVYDATAAGREFRKEFRLLSLYGGNTGPNGCEDRYSEGSRSIDWRMAAYSDGSGNSFTPCILGPSEEVVRERLQEWINARLRKREDGSSLGLAMSAVDLGLTVPAPWEEKVAEAKAKKIAAAIERARNALAEREQLLAQSRALLASLTSAPEA